MALFHYDEKGKVFRKLARGELCLVWRDSRGDELKITDENSQDYEETYYDLADFGVLRALQKSLYALETLEETLEKGWILPNGDFVSGKRHMDILVYGLDEEDVPTAERRNVCVTPQGWRDSQAEQFIPRKMNRAQENTLRRLGRCVRDKNTRDRGVSFASVFPQGNRVVASLIELHQRVVTEELVRIEEKRVKPRAFSDFLFE